ncbi:MAG: hypothetical protein K5705_16615 [Oscillospiraceae bacterium]|nr:hypothetical protein [Oscillospiraceae bacterium]MCR4761868.1 hypothetical protein [Oscillospiraceae bacterium]
MKKRILHAFLISLVVFIVWLVGQIILMHDFPESTLRTSRIWAIMMAAAACIWNLLHYRRTEKKKREDEENENYKGVY